MRGPPATDDEAPALALGLEQLDELGQVADVDVLLGHDLRHEDRVGVHLLGVRR